MAVRDLNLNVDSDNYQFRSKMVFELALGLVMVSLACDHLGRNEDTTIALFIISNVSFVFNVINYDLPFLVVKPYLLGQDRDSGLFRGGCYHL